MFSKYIIVALCAVVIGLGGYSKYLCAKIDSLETELVISKGNEVSLNKAIMTQNLAISKYELDLKSKTDEYMTLLNQPPEVRYETVYKKIPSIKVKSNECDDIKKLLDDIRTAGY